MVGQAVVARYGAHALPVGAVGGDEQVVRGADGSAEGGLDAIGAAALEEHGRVVVGAGGGQADEAGRMFWTMPWL